MAAAEWFRNSSWNPSIAEAFGAKLKRARDKKQYLRIQASYLAQSHPEVALALIEQYFQLGEHFDHAQAYVDRSVAYKALGDFDAAIASLEDALSREAVFPNLQTQAYLDLPYLIATRHIVSHFDRALELLEQGTARHMFPVDFFRAHAAKAMILNALGRTQRAREEVTYALEAARRDSSGFRYHPKLGLVSDSYRDTLSMLEAIGVA